MKIFYDGYIYYLQRAGGVNRYFSEIIARLPESDIPIIYCRPVSGLHFPTHPRLRRRTPPPLQSWLRGPLGWWASRSDVIHPTYYHLTDPLDWPRLKAPVVLTVYDFVFSKYGHLYERSGKLLSAQKIAIQRADLILCISHSTRRDLLERFPECEERSVVTHLAANIPDPGDKSPPHSKPYFLFVGARVFYKNFDVAVRCIGRLREQGYDVDLLVVGPAWNEAELRFLADTHAGEFTKLIELPEDAKLAHLYKHATALIYPSEYEGFGLPALEAMTVGTPVLALDSSSLPEVIQAGGILIPPQPDPAEAFADAALRFLSDSSFRSQTSQAARQQASKFNWDRTAEETFSAYRRAKENHAC